MLKQWILFLYLSLSLHADVLEYYKEVLKTLQYDHSYTLAMQANRLAKKGVNSRRFVNFSLDTSLQSTKAEQLHSTFTTTDIMLEDSLDLFGKESFTIQSLSLNLEEKKSQLNMQKEQLWITLLRMLRQYYTLKEQYALHKELVTQEEKLYQKLQKLQDNGMMSAMDVLRFKNTLNDLQSKIILEESHIATMQKQLKLYAPNTPIPHFIHLKLHASKKAFMHNDPAEKINDIRTQKLYLASQKLEKSYLPDVKAALAYQSLNDPTSYGDNYSFQIGLHMPLNSANTQEAEALKVEALQQQSQTREYKIEREKRYIQFYDAYVNAKKQFALLQKNLADYTKSEKTIHKAFLKQYVDFTTYLQVLRESLHVKEDLIRVKYQKESLVLLLNMIASGSIYE